MGISASKTAFSRDDGGYDLTLTISGTRGSETTPAKVDVLFIVDKSDSMDSQSRLSNAKNAMNTLVNSLESKSTIDARYSIVTFSGPERTGNSGGKNDASVHMSWTSVSGNNVRGSISSISASGGTNYQAGLDVGTDQLKSAREGATTVVIFLSDGEPTWSYNYGRGDSALNRNGGGWEETLAQAKEINCDFFYAISIGRSASDYMNDLVKTVSADTKQAITADDDGSNLTNLFEGIAGSVTVFAAEDVTVTDTLSEYVDLVLDENEDPQFTITVTHGDVKWSNSGAELTFESASGENVTVTAGYNPTTKTITLDFPDDYELEEGYTYSVSTVIEPSAVAVTAGEAGYNATGDANTGTHSGQKGFYSNDTAEVTYTANGEEGFAEFPKPVIQVTETEPDPVVVGGEDSDASMDVKKTVTGAATDVDFGFTAVFNADESAAAATEDVPAGTSDGLSYGDGALGTSITEDFAAGDTKTAKFGEVTFTKAGVYVFDVTEDNAEGTAPDGWTYDKDTETITVTVTDNGDGQLVAVVSDAASFTNSYEAEDVTIGGEGDVYSIDVTKSLTGRDWGSDDSFTFTLSADEGTPMPASNTVTITEEDQVASFGEITYDTAGVYTYTITEANAGQTIDGVTYDDSAHNVTVTIADDGQGSLYVMSVVYDGDAELESASFTNTYSDGDVTIGGDSGNAGITVAKDLQGRDWQKGDSFEFTLTADEGTPMPGEDGQTVTITEEGQTAAFGEITYDKAGDYTYTIAETHAGETVEGVTYQTDPVTVTVHVKSDGKGNLTASVDYGTEGATAASFSNVYYDPDEAKDVTLDGESVDGGGVSVGDVLTYTVAWANTSGQDGATVVVTDVIPEGTALVEDSCGDAALSEDGTTLTWTIDDVAVGATGTVSFQVTVLAEAAGDEVDNTANVTVGENEYVTNTVTVTVEEPEPEESSPTDPVDPENPDGGSWVTVTKQLAGRDLAEGEFQFVLSGVEGTASEGMFATGTNDADGNVKLGGVTFTAAGTYEFTLSEVDGGLGGVAYDGATYGLTADVTLGNDGALSVSWSCDEGDELVFSNVYTPEPETSSPTDPDDPETEGVVEGGMTITKVLDGRDLAAGEFTFQLVDASGTVVSKGTNDADGNVTLSGITFTTAGTYEYTLSEVDGGLGGVAYDGETYAVTATVTDNGEGHLVVSWSYDTADVTFTNSYTAGGTVSVVVGGYKDLDGRDLVAGEFTFQLVDADGNVVATGTNDAFGLFALGAIDFTEPGTYEYTLSEVKGDLDGVTYDDATYTVVVTIGDDGRGNLMLAGLTYNGEAELPTFENTYVEPAASTGTDGSGSGDSGSDGTVPDTGDHTSAMLPVAFVGLGALVIAGALTLRKRSNR